MRESGQELITNSPPVTTGPRVLESIEMSQRTALPFAVFLGHGL